MTGCGAMSHRTKNITTAPVAITSQQLLLSNCRAELLGELGQERLL